MDTWNAVPPGMTEYNRRVIADRLMGCSPPHPSASIPSGKGPDAEWRRPKNAKRLLTVNSLFMDTQLTLIETNHLLPDIRAGSKSD